MTEGKDLFTLEANSSPDYNENRGAELKQVRESALWQAGAAVLDLRREDGKRGAEASYKEADDKTAGPNSLRRAVSH